MKSNLHFDFKQDITYFRAFTRTHFMLSFTNEATLGESETAAKTDRTMGGRKSEM